jgi:hypothetical protein
MLHDVVSAQTVSTLDVFGLKAAQSGVKAAAGGEGEQRNNFIRTWRVG